MTILLYVVMSSSMLVVNKVRTSGVGSTLPPRRAPGSGCSKQTLQPHRTQYHQLTDTAQHARFRCAAGGDLSARALRGFVRAARHVGCVSTAAAVPQRAASSLFTFPVVRRTHNSLRPAESQLAGYLCKCMRADVGCGRAACGLQPLRQCCWASVGW